MIQNPEIEYLINKFYHIMFRQILALDLKSFKIQSKYIINDQSDIIDAFRMSQILEIECLIIKIHRFEFRRILTIDLESFKL